MADDEVHPELAMELIRKLRTRGGTWRLLQTGLLITSPVFLLLAIASMNAIGIVAAGAATAVLVRNLVQNARAITAAKFLSAVDNAGGRRIAVMRGRMLHIGHAGTPVEFRPGLRISAREEQQLRALALPAARLVDS